MLHIRLGIEDSDIIQWKKSLPSRTFSYYVKLILTEERRRRIAPIPVPVIRQEFTQREECKIVVDEKNLVNYLCQLPERSRGKTVKAIIRKHIAANSRADSLIDRPEKIDILELAKKGLQTTESGTGQQQEESIEDEYESDYRKMLEKLAGG